MKKINRSVVIPAILVVYLGVMAYIGRDLYFGGAYLEYFSIIGVSLLVIILLHFSLKRKERLRKEREDDMNMRESNSDGEYTTYEEEDKKLKKD